MNISKGKYFKYSYFVLLIQLAVEYNARQIDWEISKFLTFLPM